VGQPFRLHETPHRFKNAGLKRPERSLSWWQRFGMEHQRSAQIRRSSRPAPHETAETSPWSRSALRGRGFVVTRMSYEKPVRLDYPLVLLMMRVANRIDDFDTVATTGPLIPATTGNINPGSDNIRRRIDNIRGRWRRRLVYYRRTWLTRVRRVEFYRRRRSRLHRRRGSGKIRDQIAEQGRARATHAPQHHGRSKSFRGPPCPGSGASYTPGSGPPENTRRIATYSGSG
jgi:hypothetical protein